MKKLPIGIYTLKTIIEENYLYIDKTEIALDLINNNRYVFLSRPRRFGKSLFLDTLKEIFEGNKELFKGLHIYDKWNFEKKYPVIRISFASGKVKNREELDDRIFKILKKNQEDLGISCEFPSDIAGCFQELIIKSYEKYKEKVVILIDEYDKPILDNIEDKKIASEMRDGLANFYSVIKGSDEVSDSEDNPEILPKPMKSQYLRFAFLTGVSKFAKTSIFSGLNNITDITLNPKYGNICGYTQQDIETSFLPYLDGVELEKLKTWYNGYNFLKDKVYNPYNILLFIQNDKLYKNYWFETGTPTFLIKLIKENNYFLPKLSNLRIGEELLNSFDVENIKVETLFFQTGYLTINTQEINEFDELEYTLIIPNKEVENSLSKYIIQEMYGANSLENRKNLIKALSTEDLINLKEVLFSLFASIPYNNYTKNNISSYEGYYASIIYVYFLSLGLNIIAEDVTNKGRIDLTVILNDKVYILEFKVLNSTPKTNTALKQIQEKKYHEKYLSKYNNIYQIGIIFNEKKRNIVKFDYKKVVAH